MAEIKLSLDQEADIRKYIRMGIKDENWYQDTEKLFIKIFGAQRLHIVAQLFAATSINSSLKSNVRLFRKALHEIDNNLPFSNYLPVMLLQLERIRKGEPIQGRKISSFAAAISGDPNAVVVDIWLLRAFGLNRQYLRAESNTRRESGATDKQYSFVEQYVRTLAPDYRLEPRQLSAVIWSGTRIHNTGDKQTTYKEVLLHQLYNMFETK